MKLNVFVCIYDLSIDSIAGYNRRWHSCLMRAFRF